LFRVQKYRPEISSSTVDRLGGDGNEAYLAHYVEHSSLSAIVM